MLAKDKEVGGIEIIIHERGASCKLIYTIKIKQPSEKSHQLGDSLGVPPIVEILSGKAQQDIA